MSQIRHSARNRPNREQIVPETSAMERRPGRPNFEPRYRPKPPTKRPMAARKIAASRRRVHRREIVAGIPKSEFPEFPSFPVELANSPVGPKSAVGPKSIPDDSQGPPISGIVVGRNSHRNSLLRCRTRRREVVCPSTSCRRNPKIRVSRLPDSLQGRRESASRPEIRCPRNLVYGRPTWLFW